MLIPLRHIHVEAPRPTATTQSWGTHAASQTDAFDAHMRWISQMGSAVFRALVLLCATLSWSASQNQQLALAAALLVAAGGIIAAIIRPHTGMVVADGVAATLLILGTGGAASPFLVLPLTLGALGALGGGWRGTTAGTLAGVAALVLAALAGPTSRDEVALGMAAATAALGAGCVWALRRSHGTLDGVRAALRRQERAGRRSDDALRALNWQRLNQAALDRCRSAEELRRRTAERAMTIAGAAATVVLPGEATGSEGGCAFAMTDAEERGGLLAVHVPSLALDAAQREALEHLAALAGGQAAILRAQAQLERQQDALIALWEVGGVVRAASDHGSLQAAFGRLAAALGLDWLALVAPDERQAISALVLASGSDATPRIHSAQLRVAAETLRAGRTLVRAEGEAALVCLPMRAECGPLALVARGDAAETATQALLMVFGDLVAAGMAGRAP